MLEDVNGRNEWLGSPVAPSADAASWIEPSDTITPDLATNGIPATGVGHDIETSVLSVETSALNFEVISNEMLTPDTSNSIAKRDPSIDPITGETVAIGQSASNISSVRAASHSGSVDLLADYFNVIQEPLDTGDRFDVKFRVENTGSSDSGSFPVGFYLSTDRTITNSDSFLGSYTVSSLVPGATSSTITKQLMLPHVTDSFWNGSRDYYIGIKIDDLSWISETSESNNTRSDRVYITASNSSSNGTADLSADYFNVTPEPLNAGDSFDAKFRVENLGSGNAGSFRAGFYLSTNSTISTSDRFLGSYNFSSLAAGDTSSTITERLTLPSASDSFWRGSQRYYIGMLVDDRREVSETRENNNTDDDGVSIDVGSILEENQDRWTAQFINRHSGNYDDWNFSIDRNSGTVAHPDATADLGHQNSSGNSNTIARLYKNWGDGSPVSGVPSDYFAMLASTQVDLQAGKYYKVTSDSDDGFAFHLNKTWKNGNDGWIQDPGGFEQHDWRDRSTSDPAQTTVFTVDESGTYDFLVKYYENSGGAVVDVTLEEIPVQEAVDEQTQWRGWVYEWESQGSDRPSPNNLNEALHKGVGFELVGAINLGSNIRYLPPHITDGRNGINDANWGSGPVDGNGRLPRDHFVVKAYTEVEFDRGDTYEFQATGDDGYQIWLKNLNSDNWYWVTDENQWQSTHNGETEIFPFTIEETGPYYVGFFHYENEGDAGIGLNWKEVTTTTPIDRDDPLLTQQGADYFQARPQFYTTGNIFSQSRYGSNLVDGYSRTEGNCTWYAHGRVKELGGDPAALDSMRGNANQWHTQLSNGSRILGSNESPQIGDIAQWTRNGQNHVAVVEAVNSDGTITISESHYRTNYDGGGRGTLHRIEVYTADNPDRYIRVPGVSAN